MRNFVIYLFMAELIISIALLAAMVMTGCTVQPLPQKSSWFIKDAQTPRQAMYNELEEKRLKLIPEVSDYCVLQYLPKCDLLERKLDRLTEEQWRLGREDGEALMNYTILELLSERDYGFKGVGK